MCIYIIYIILEFNSDILTDICGETHFIDIYLWSLVHKFLNAFNFQVLTNFTEQSLL